MSVWSVLGLSIAMGACAALLAAAQRVWVLRRSWGFFAQGFAGDASVHLAIVRALRADSSTRFVKQYLISPEPMSYPTGFHRIAALFSDESIVRRPYLPNFFLFVGASGLFFALLPWLLAPSGGDTRSVMLAIAAAAIVYFCSCSNLVFGGPAIAYLKLSERLLGRLACSGFVFFLWLSVVLASWVWLFAAAVCGAIALSSSIFARQTILFGTPLMAIFVWQLTPIFALLGSALLAYLVSKDHFLRGMRHTILTWKLYATLTKRSPHVREGLPQSWDPRELWNLKFQPWTMLTRFCRVEPGRTIFANSELLLAFLLLASNIDLADFGLMESTRRLVVFFPLAVAIALFFITITERFNHLGEGYRYVEYSTWFVAPTMVAFAVVSALQPWHWIAIACYVVLTVGFSVFLDRINQRATQWPHDDALADFLSEIDLPSGAVVFPVTMRLGADLCARREDIKSFWWQPGIISEGIYDEFIEEYPYLKRDWWDLFDRYAVTHVVVDRAMDEAKSWSYDYSALALIAETERYQAYRVELNAGVAR